MSGSSKTPESSDSLRDILPPNDSAKLDQSTLNAFCKIFPDTSTQNQGPAPTIDAMRQGLASLLKTHGVQYPSDLNDDSYTIKEIGGLGCYVIRHSSPNQVPTLVMFIVNDSPIAH